MEKNATSREAAVNQIARTKFNVAAADSSASKKFLWACVVLRRYYDRITTRKSKRAVLRLIIDGNHAVFNTSLHR